MSHRIDPATALTDRIMSLEADSVGEGALISRREVLAIVASAVPVEIDMDMYSEVLETQTVTDEQKETLATVSTVYNLLADKAAEFAARDVRKQAEDLGMELITDAEMFAKNKDNPDPDAVRSYHDLAHHSESVVEQLGEIFAFLVDQSTREATMGLVMSMTSDLGMDLPDLQGLNGLLSGGLNGLHFEDGGL